MTNFKKQIKLTLAAALTVAALGACATKIDKAAISATANPSDEIARLEQEAKAGVEQHVDVLAPEDYKQANKYISKAKDDVNDKKDQSKIIEDISYATSFMNRARAKSDERRGSIEGVLQARSAALAAGVNNYKAERDRFDKLGDEIADSSGNLTKNLTPDDISRLQKEFMALEVASISARELGDTRARIAGAKDGKAEKRTPNTLKQAQVDLRNAENVLNQNAKNPEAYRAEVQKANTSSLFLVAVLDEAKKNGKNTSESVAIQLAQKNQKIGSLQTNLNQTQENVNVLGSTVAKQNQQLSLQQALEKARKEFSKDEAEVFQQGNNLLIRLKTMNFAVGGAALPQDSLPVLAKVNEVIGSLNTSKVVVEGHTDSTGDAKVNQKVSQERADAVAKYLETSGVSTEKLTAVGYGYKKPLANNKNKTGRAQNRRVDVIVTVAKKTTAGLDGAEDTESTAAAPASTEQVTQ